MKTYLLRVPPCAKPRMTRADTWKKRPATTKYWEFKDALVIEAKKKGFKLLECDMHIIFHMQIPKTWSKKKQSCMINLPHRQRPDLDNMLKAFQDSLTDEDSFIYDVRVSKVWDKTGYIEIICEE